MKMDIVDLEVSLVSIGMDSMLAIEIKNRIELLYGINLTVIDLLNNSSINELVVKIYDALIVTLELQTEEELLADLSDEEFAELLAEISDNPCDKSDVATT
jgi:acyl carrier protein